MNILPGTGSDATKSPTQNMGELNKNLRTLNQSICCLNNSTSAANSNYTATPVYVYKKVYTPIFSTTDPSPLLITDGEGSIRFQYTGDVYDMCSEFGVISDPICTFIYEDSTGFKQSNGAVGNLIKDYSKLLGLYAASTKQIFFKITLVRTSGFQQVCIGSFIIDNGDFSNIIISDNFTNTNVSNIDTIALGGLIPTPYEIMVEDILEIRENGIFLKYVDLNHTDYTVPEGVCLSYNPVMPFTELVDITIPITYNTISRYVVINGSKTFSENTFHKISYSVISGVGTIEIDGDGTSLLAGLSETFEATTLLNKEVVITSPDAGTTIIVTTTTI